MSLVYNFVLALTAIFIFPVVSAYPSHNTKLLSRAITGRYIVGFKDSIDSTAHVQWADSIHKRNVVRRDESEPSSGIETMFRRINAYVGHFDPATIETIKANPDVSFHLCVVYQPLIRTRLRTLKKIKYSKCLKLNPRQPWSLRPTQHGVST